MDHSKLLKLSLAVKNAFIIKGSNPKYHDKEAQRLKIYWPELYKSIKNLSEFLKNHE
jgi:hypothetical protein